MNSPFTVALSFLRCEVSHLDDVEFYIDIARVDGDIAHQPPMKGPM
jgi:hypothetical protein